jgi:hypothetical protein
MMTEQENIAIVTLTKMIEQHCESNAEAHRQIIDLIKDTERRLCAKITQTVERLDGIDEQLAQRKQMFESEIEAAKEAAVVEAKRPSVYRQATAGLFNWMIKVVGLAAALGATAVAVHHFWS